MTADLTFERVAIYAERTCQPLERGAAIAATLRELAPVVGHLPLSMCAAAETFFVLGRIGPQASAEDSPALAARRRTCEELEGALATDDHADGTHEERRSRAVAVWATIGTHLRLSAGENPRLKAMRDTFERELLELLLPRTQPTIVASAATAEGIARRIYQTYAQHADWKDYKGEPLPTFDEMRETTRSHWHHVAEDLCIYGLNEKKNAQRIEETKRAV